jgi:hypothetical protein
MFHTAPWCQQRAHLVQQVQLSRMRCQTHDERPSVQQICPNFASVDIMQKGFLRSDNVCTATTIDS